MELSMTHPEVGVSVLCPGWCAPGYMRPTATVLRSGGPHRRGGGRRRGAGGTGRHA
ncbi:MAG: hypothetical protein M5U19_22885 [Microthrixaceae bacterium]|nr:hypothetical protein [Microthrixaceae bacterium]